MTGQRFPNMATSSTPGAVSYETTDFVAWKGEGDDPALFYSMVTYKNGGVSGIDVQTKLSFLTSTGPAMASFGGRLYLAWKEQTNKRIRVADGTQQFPGLGIISWSAARDATGEVTDSAPTMVGTPAALYLAWRGPGDNVQVWWSKSQDGQTWLSQGLIPQVGNTISEPALAAIGNVVFLAWKAAAGDDRIFWSKCTDGKNWATQAPVASVGGTSTGPALGVDSDGSLRVAWKAEPGDDRIFFSVLTSPLTNTNWSAQQVVNGATTPSRPALASNSGALIWRGSDSGFYVGLLDTIAPPLPQRPIDLSPPNGNFSNPVRLRWKDPAAGSKGQADYFQFYAAVNEIALLGNGLVVTGGPVTESAPVTFPNGQAQWGVQGVNVSGLGPFAVVNFTYQAGPHITVERAGNTNNFTVTGSGFTPNGSISVTVQTAIAGGTAPISAFVSADGNGNLSPYTAHCGPMCSSAHGGGLKFIFTDQATSATANATANCV
jgi:hypothetical protein